MSTKAKSTGQLEDLQAQAQQRLKDTDGPGTEPKLDRLHELQTHQVELELQNEQLRATQVELKVARDRYVGLYHHAPVGYLSVDDDGVIQEANETFAQMIGVSLESLFRRRVDELIFEGDQDAFYLFRGELRAGERHSLELRLKTADGRALEARMDGVVTSESGDGLAVSLAVSDITRRRESEARLKVQEEELRRARTLESLGLLSGGLAHDFNNLLTPILLHCDMALDGLPSDDSCFDDLVGIRESATRAQGLTKKLLSLSRGGVVEMVSLDLGRAVRERYGTLRRLLRENIDLTLQVDPGNMMVHADETQLDQIMLNLCINAQDAMSGGGTLSLCVERRNALHPDPSLPVKGQLQQRDQSAPGDSTPLDSSVSRRGEAHAESGKPAQKAEYVVLSVADTGCGMSPATLRKACDPFFSTKERGRGTGLGLATVHGLVQQHGGWLEIFSEPGQGSVFRLYFPHDKVVTEADSVPSPTPEPVTGSETILVAEDEPRVRALTARLLRRWGYEVMEAEDGVEALEQAMSFPRTIHLLITDLIMPRMGGDELRRRLVAARPAMGVLVMSGYADGAVQQGEVDKQEVSLLPKPFSAKALASAVGASMSRRPHRSDERSERGPVNG